MQAYQIRSSSSSLPQTVVMTSPVITSQGKSDDPQMKREIRLAKNRSVCPQKPHGIDYIFTTYKPGVKPIYLCKLYIVVKSLDPPCHVMFYVYFHKYLCCRFSLKASRQ